MSVEIKALAASDEKRWDEYVSQHPAGTPFHLIAWRDCMVETFRYQPHYICAVRDGRFRGVLPLFFVSNLIVGKALLSSPFAVYGGILADDAGVRDAIRAHVEELAEKKEASYVELRNGLGVQSCGYSAVDRYAGFCFDLPRDAKDILPSLPKKTRNMVRKALKFGYSVRRGVRDPSGFERLFSVTMRRHGTPTFPISHFESILKHFGAQVDISEFQLNGRTVAASLNFHFRKIMHVYYAASDPAYLQYAPNDFMYFDHLCWATLNMYDVFDFGRSKINSGPFHFKRRWGVRPEPLPYEIRMLNAESAPNHSPTNPRYQLAIDVWKRLPLGLTRLIGPRVVRLFP